MSDDERNDLIQRYKHARRYSMECYLNDYSTASWKRAEAELRAIEVTAVLNGMSVETLKNLTGGP